MRREIRFLLQPARARVPVCLLALRRELRFLLQPARYLYFLKTEHARAATRPARKTQGLPEGAAWKQHVAAFSARKSAAASCVYFGITFPNQLNGRFSLESPCESQLKTGASWRGTRALPRSSTPTAASPLPHFGAGVAYPEPESPELQSRRATQTRTDESASCGDHRETRHAGPFSSFSS